MKNKKGKVTVHFNIDQFWSVNFFGDIVITRPRRELVKEIKGLVTWAIEQRSLGRKIVAMDKNEIGKSYPLTLGVPDQSSIPEEKET